MLSTLTPQQTTALRRTCMLLEEFEASESIANTGTGARAEGHDFEDIVAAFWTEVASLATQLGAKAGPEYRLESAGAGRNRRSSVYRRFDHDSRRLYLPLAQPTPGASRGDDERTFQWLKLSFDVEALAVAYPGRIAVRERYAPQGGPYAGDSYWEMFRGLTTNFDDSVVLEDNGVLVEKILLEYKTAKSSRGRAIDGNAHERLSFQILQYLEVATQYPSCRFEVLANGAFRNYRNKYHLGFNQQADRLSSFRWFQMAYRCEAHQYESLAADLLLWLSTGKKRDSR